MAYTDTVQLELIDTRTTTGARVVHLSPDAAIAASGPVEVFASSSALPSSPAELIPSFSYTETVPGTNSYVGVAAGDYIFDVAPDGAGIGSSVYTSPTISLATAAEYTVIAAGYVLTSPAFVLLATQDSNRSIGTQASVKVVHGAPLAGTVDVYVSQIPATGELCCRALRDASWKAHIGRVIQHLSGPYLKKQSSDKSVATGYA